MTIAIVEISTLVVTVGSYAASITAASIASSFDALSHFPERRAAAELSDLAARINAFGAYVDQLAAQESVADSFKAVDEKQAFAIQHVAITRAFWAAESRCMNWFVTGSANFPAARNEKRQRSADVRSADLEQLQERGDVETKVESSLGEIEIVENTEAARIQLFFPGKADDQTRSLLKSNGFRWSPSHGAWQRHLNENGRWAAKRVVKQLQDEGEGA